MFDSYLKRFKRSNWQLQNETIIAVGLFLFSMTILLAYQGVLQSISDGHVDTRLTYYSLIAYPMFCVVRLLALTRFGTHRRFGIVTSIVDSLLLSVILFMFSVQYGSAAATLKSPSFAFYFVLIALHGMRFIPKITLINGACCIFAWVCIVLMLKSQNADFTQSYIEYINSGAVMIGTEFEKILALCVFTCIVAFGAKRVSELHDQEKEGQKKLFEQERDAQKVLHLKEQEAQDKLSKITLQEEQRVSRLKTEFINTMSHELRTPMNGVLGMLQALRLTETNEKQSKMIDIMETSGDRLVNLLSDILEYSKFADHKINFKKTAFDLRDFVKTVSDQAQKNCAGKNLTLKVHFDPKTPNLLVGDTARISKVLDQLLDNAIKFTDTGNVGLVIKGKTDGERATLYFEVYDQGIGIADANLEKIFTPFHQIDGSNTRAYEGTGIGLALSQRIVMAMGSQILVQSTVGQGSRFGFYVSLQQQKREAAKAISA